MSPSIGSEKARAQYSAPKKAPKNITSEKMNQLMLQRYDTSTRLPYMPPSDSEMASPNQCHSTNSTNSRPMNVPAGPQVCPFTHDASDASITSRPHAAMTGCRDGCGTK